MWGDLLSAIGKWAKLKGTTALVFGLLSGFSVYVYMDSQSGDGDLSTAISIGDGGLEDRISILGADLRRRISQVEVQTGTHTNFFQGVFDTRIEDRARLDAIDTRLLDVLLAVERLKTLADQ